MFERKSRSLENLGFLHQINLMFFGFKSLSKKVGFEFVFITLKNIQVPQNTSDLRTTVIEN